MKWVHVRKFANFANSVHYFTFATQAKPWVSKEAKNIIGF